MTFLKLFDRIVIRSFRRDRFLTALSVLGVALGVGLFLGVNTATNRAVSSFEAGVTGIDPGLNYQVMSLSGIDFPDNVYATVRSRNDSSLPVQLTNAFLPDLGESVEVTGIYTVRAAPLLAPGRTGMDVPALLTTPNGVLVTLPFADRHRIQQGDRLKALVYDRQYVLQVVGVIDLPAAPAALLMDLGNFQDFFRKTGELSRIDLAADEQGAAELGRVLPAGIAIRKKESLLRNRQSLVDAFRSNLRFVTFLAVLVGVFLLYNTVFMSVVKRRNEIGILRGLGMDRSTLVALFSAQGVLLGLLGSILGLGLGQAGAWVSSRMVGGTITRFYGGGSPSSALLTASDIFWTVGLGLAVAFGASFIPALESALIRPMETTRAGTFEKDYRKRQTVFSLAAGLLVACGAALTLVDYAVVPFAFPWLSHAGILLFILGCTLFAPAYLQAVLSVAKPFLSRLFRTTGPIAAGDLSGTRYRFSLALMSVAVSSALIVAIVSSIYSLKRSFTDWIDTYISADFYVKPASCTSNFCFYPLPDAVVKTVEKLPGVETVGRFRSLQVNFRGMPVVAGFSDSGLMAKYTPGTGSEERARIARLADRREVSISDYIAVKYGLKKGDVVEIETPGGAVPFTVNNTSISYSTLSGFLYFDRRWLREYWGLDDATQLSIYLESGYDRQAFLAGLRRTLSSYALEISDTRELRESVLRVFDRSFAVTYAIEFIAIAISLIGVVNALLILVLEKKREISVLRYLGAGWGHIRQIMLLSAAVIGAAGIALGAFMGTVISLVITHVINRISFGWEVAFRAPWLTLSLLMAVLFATTVLAAIVPSYVARKIDPKAFVSFE